MLHRALIKTHHMTSRKKITAINKAAKKYDCAVYLKTGARPPGCMIAESEGEEGVRAWVASVKVRDALSSMLTKFLCWALAPLGCLVYSIEG